MHFQGHMKALFKVLKIPIQLKEQAALNYKPNVNIYFIVIPAGG